MATFYVLPPRLCLEEQLGNLLERMFPGLPIPAEMWDVLLLHLAGHSGWSRDLHLIPRNELPPDEPLEAALKDYFGAEPGDRVVEVPFAPHASATAPVPRTWNIEASVVSTPCETLYNFPNRRVLSNDQLQWT